MKKFYFAISILAMSCSAYAMTTEELTLKFTTSRYTPQKTQDYDGAVRAIKSDYKPCRHQLYNGTDEPVITKLQVQFDASYKPEDGSAPTIGNFQYEFSQYERKEVYSQIGRGVPIIIKKTDIFSNLIRTSFLAAIANEKVSAKNGQIEISSTKVTVTGFLKGYTDQNGFNAQASKCIGSDGGYYDKQEKTITFRGLPLNITIGLQERVEETQPKYHYDFTATSTN